MAAKVKEKLPLLQKDEIKCRELITNFKKILNLWFMHGMVDNTIVNEVLNSCMEIILHGLKPQSKKLQPKTNAIGQDYGMATITLNQNENRANDQSTNELQKVIDDFEWVCNAVNIKRNLSNSLPRKFSLEEKGAATTSRHSHCLQKQLKRDRSQSSAALVWLENNLNEENLCSFLQYWVNDKELLGEHYIEDAFLRQDIFVSILKIGLTAFETKQYGLLSQFDAVIEQNLKEISYHRRSYSQPNILVPKPKSNISILEQTNTIIATDNQHYSATGLTTIRKTQSLPEFIQKLSNVNVDTDDIILKRSRCRTIGAIEHTKTSPQNIPQKALAIVNKNLKSNDSHITSSPGLFKYDNDDSQPTTSLASSNRSKSSLSNYTLNSNKSGTSSLMSTSVSSCNSNNTTKYIQLINTDDIKIWTDHSWELKQKCKQQSHLDTTASCAVPTPLPNAKPSKSISPLNSFFFSLFNNPPSYTSWFGDHELQNEYEDTETAIESIIPDNNLQIRNSISSPQRNSPSVSTVLDQFLPIDGKKVRARKSQNLFDDVNTTLDYSGMDTETPVSTSSPASTSSNSKNCQSLTRFLQMSHLSRNNTDLEKENAHFLISEAIISAIEHIKWNKLERRKDKSFQEATPLATDCLASPEPLKNSSVKTVSSDIIEGEYVPYAELEEVNYDLLSAEIVGLSLISKFDEKHLPKVSELKWLVSDNDTPQKLLPMPDLSSSANPDENVIHAATRGTRYWAPPRQQIIFTEHPPQKRKELLKQQNYRCAGCGMRVASQYIQSFRYCTYLGKYHCTGCHRNQISATPAKILQSWDFKCYPVSVFAYRLLEQMYSYPLFYVPDLNPALYLRSNALLTARNKRLQLKYVKDFIHMCRFALHERSYFESVPDYITGDVDNWSMSDFVDARIKCLHRSIDELISKCETHILNCVVSFAPSNKCKWKHMALDQQELCTARGFLCEHCHADEVIYPWGSRIERCNNCGSCFHRSCWKSMSEKCRRCQRIDKRHDEINGVL